MVNGLSFHLLKVPFQLYVTLTFGGNWNDKKSRNKTERLYSWLRFVYGHHCSDETLKGKIFVVAEELGEQGGRYHLHLLLGSLPKRPSKADCFSMAWLWKDFLNGGFAKIRPYDPSLGGVDYVLKTLSLVDLRSVSSDASKSRAQTLAGAHVGSFTTYAGANRYEVGKIGQQYEQGLEVTLSLGLLTLLQSGANSRRGKERSRGFFRRLKTDARQAPVKKR